jgi:hypothetical protein
VSSSELVAAEIVPAPAPAPAMPTTLFGTSDPDEILVEVTRRANALASVIEKQKLAVLISGRKYVRVEGWTCLGALAGVFPICVWSRPLENGWESRVEARTLTGAIVGAAEAMCLRSERSWASRDDFSLRSMSQTRATSKALRAPLGFIMALAGFEATPAEEVPAGGFDEPVKPAKPVRAPKPVSALPAEEPSPLTPPPASAASGAQLNNIYRLINKIDQLELVPREKMIAAITAEYELEQEPGSESLKGLGKSQASDLITRLMTKAGEGA